MNAGGLNGGGRLGLSASFLAGVVAAAAVPAASALAAGIAAPHEMFASVASAASAMSAGSAVTASASTPARATELPADLAWEVLLTGLSQPVAVRHAGDGSRRLFVVEKGGSIRIVQLHADGSASLKPTPFLSRPVTTSGESGLLGLAFHPDFASNGHFYVAFTAHGFEPRLGAQPDQVIARYTVSADDPDRADTGTRLDILRVPDLAATHNGGDLHFGPDGYLYYSSGDGGPLNDPNGFALCDWKKPADGDPANCTPTPGLHNYWLLGKILRIDVDTPTASPGAHMCGVPAGQPAPYSIPADNPYVGIADTCDEIWHTGLRNPWRFSFDRFTGEMYIGDVGQNAREEVNRAGAGEGGLHFGWPCMEGTRVNRTTPPCVDDPVNAFPGSTLPLFEYPHVGGAAVTGGYVYRGPVQRLQGSYWFADNVTARVYSAQPLAGGGWQVGERFIGMVITGFGEDWNGHLYAGNFLHGTLLRLTSEAIFDDGFDSGETAPE